VAGDAANDLSRPRAIHKSSTSARSPECYFTGDGARRDEDGYFWIMGRVDDVINVAGHRLGTMEIESALVSHPPWPRPRWSDVPTI
jgi:acyl-coenzyme A synthetase/AMP-(fatty) acid ligase